MQICSLATIMSLITEILKGMFFHVLVFYSNFLFLCSNKLGKIVDLYNTIRLLCFIFRSIPLAVNGPFCTLSASTPKGLDFESLESRQAQIGLDQWQPENDSNTNKPMFFNPEPTLTQHKNVKQADQPNSENIQSNSSKNNESGCANEHQSVQSPPKVLEASLCDSLPLEVRIINTIHR